MVDIGGGTSESAVISLGGVVKKSSFRVAGNHFDAAIIEYVRQNTTLKSEKKLLKKLQVKIGTVVELEEDLSLDVSGKNLFNGSPKDITLYSLAS